MNNADYELDELEIECTRHFLRGLDWRGNKTLLMRVRKLWLLCSTSTTDFCAALDLEEEEFCMLMAESSRWG